MKTLIIMRGHPGAGKSTFVKERWEYEPFVCSADSFFSLSGKYEYDASKIGEAHNLCMRQFLHAIETNESLIIVDNTNIRIMDYIPYVRVAEALGWKVYQKVMTGCYQNVHGVPENKVERMRKDLQEDKFLEHLPDGLFKKD